MTNHLYPSKSIYLAGPITGLSYEEARLGWRQEFSGLLLSHIFPFSPMRKKDFLSGNTNLSGDPASYKNALATDSAITTRDHNDVRTCDLIVANFLGAERASIGTAVEFGWADAYRKPIVTIIEEDGWIIKPYIGEVDALKGQMVKVKNPHYHMMLSRMSGVTVHSLEAAAEIVNHLLTPGI